MLKLIIQSCDMPNPLYLITVIFNLKNCTDELRLLSIKGLRFRRSYTYFSKKYIFYRRASELHVSLPTCANDHQFSKMMN